MRWDTAASLSLLYLILYSLVLGHIIVLYITKEVSIRSRYTYLAIHVLFRLAAQSVGLAFAIVGYANVGLLIAYFVLGAEGYFTLVLCAYRFTISWHEMHFISGQSWLEPKQEKKLNWWQATAEGFRFYTKDRGLQWMGVIHCFLAVANSLIVSGGSIVSGDNANDDDRVRTSAVMRTIGQAVFLVINFGLLLVLGLTIRQAKAEAGGYQSGALTPQRPKDHTTKHQEIVTEQIAHTPSASEPPSIHPTLILLLLIWPLLVVRGFYGLLSPFVRAFNYFDSSNYGSHGLTLKFVTYEYVLGTTMEWASCALLVGTWWAERYHPGKTEKACSGSTDRS
ncbi:hypothetical protein ONZ45_g2889 [Pleurotus djamor]|nr:hypothetical protein ONZ45_g2889 [Pleurotus djamor]